MSRYAWPQFHDYFWKSFKYNRKQEPHNIISRRVCYYIQVILEESATSSEGHEHLFMCMACSVYILSVLTDISFDAFCFFAIAVYLSPLSWSIELIIIFLFWGEVSVFWVCFSIFGQWMYLTVVAGAIWVYCSISICWWHWLLVYFECILASVVSDNGGWWVQIWDKRHSVGALFWSPAPRSLS